MNLNFNMPANVVMNAIWEKGIPQGDKIWWGLAGIVVFAVIGGVIGSIAAAGLEAEWISAFEAIAITSIGAGLAGVAAWLWDKITDLLPDILPIPQGNDTLLQTSVYQIGLMCLMRVETQVKAEAHLYRLLLLP